MGVHIENVNMWLLAHQLMVTEIIDVSSRILFLRVSEGVLWVEVGGLGLSTRLNIEIFG